jgi:quinolinate synthase
MNMIVWDDSPGLDVVERIMELKKRRNAFILAHNFQSPEIQFVADYVGDALSLAMEAAKAEQPVIVVCGPDFMVENAKILAPNKTVLFANELARCPMAAMITPKELRGLKRVHPDAKVVGYINTSAYSKCEMDICCTSSNAVKVIRSLSAQEIIFVPDQNLGAYVKTLVPEKSLILWAGFCSVHQRIKKEDILELSRAHPGAKILVHPECTPDVVALADAVLSTDGIRKYGADPTIQEFIVATEIEVANTLSDSYPDKMFYPIEKASCQTQKKIKLGHVLEALEALGPEVNLSGEVIKLAKLPLERMLEIGRGD